MPKPAKTALLLTILARAAGATAQQPNPSPLKPLAFLTGRWTSETPTEIQEENWSPIIGNSMTGSFRVKPGILVKLSSPCGMPDRASVYGRGLACVRSGGCIPGR